MEGLKQGVGNSHPDRRVPSDEAVWGGREV